MNRALLFAVSLVLFALSGPLGAEAPFVDPATDAEHFGPMDKVLFWSPDQQVAGYRNMDRLGPGRWVHAGTTPLVLPERPVDLDDLPIAHDGSNMTLGEYLKRQSVAGLLVIKDGAIAYERYRLGNDRQTR